MAAISSSGVGGQWGVWAGRRLIFRLLVATVSAALLACGSAAAAAAAISVYPVPGSRVATPETQISFRGLAPSALGTISVTGSASGVHAGHLSADSDGRGASFYPDAPFAPGEVVTVRTSLPIIGGQGGTFEFTVQHPAPAVLPSDHSPAPRRRNDVESFRSRPDLRPVAVRIRQAYSGASDIFLTPMRGPLQWGPMIVDRWGHLVWFLPLSGPTTTATNFTVQHYGGQPVLTWWQGFINGFGQGVDVILDHHYRRLTTVHAGNGLTADLHEFSITPQGTALLTAYRPVYWDASSVGASRNLDVLNCTVQEIDIRTGNVLFQWDSLDHVPLRDSYMPVPKPGAGAFDYFHVNSIQQSADGNLIISARNTWAVYKLDHTTGAVMWTLGGRDSSFKMGPGTRTAFQHDAILHPGNLMTIFDDGAWPKVHRQSRVVVERLKLKARTATLVRAIDHKPKVIAGIEGSAQLLGNGNIFVGWGQGGFFSDYDRRGRQIYDGRFVGPQSSYRAFEFAWHGQPDTPPALAVRRRSGGASVVYASWNGATDVARWRVLAGPSPHALRPLITARRHGFETAIGVRTERRYVAVVAIGSSGQVLGRSPVHASGASR